MNYCIQQPLTYYLSELIVHLGRYNSGRWRYCTDETVIPVRLRAPLEESITVVRVV